jgi:hypothetical protein
MFASKVGADPRGTNKVKLVAGAVTLSIMTFSIMTHSITLNNEEVSINDTLHLTILGI